MTDVNEESFSAGISTDGATAQHASRSSRSRTSTPIWRFKPSLQPIEVVRTIKTRIIPKIVLALTSAPKPSDPPKQEDPAAAGQFAALVLGEKDETALAFVEKGLAQGASVESVFVDLLAPTAQHLGDGGESDATNFANATRGVSRLQTIMRRLGDRFFEQARQSDGGGSALLTTIPGEQNSFGLSIPAEFFRRAGWNLCTEPFSSHQELTSLVHDQWFDVVWFSVSSERRLDELAEAIHNIRRESRNRNVGIMLGGPMLARYPGLAASVGADIISTDATAAPQQARSLVEQMRGQT